MQKVTDRTSNPFDMRPPCKHRCSDDGPAAVFGYGDANADFHVIGDHPGVHGGRETGIPFTGSRAGERLQAVLSDVGLLKTPPSDRPVVSNCFLSYLHMCCPPVGENPSTEDYAELERFFDAELRAIASHVLVPVGSRATRHVLENYTARAPSLADDMPALHGREVKGSGWLVLPVREPDEWTDGDDERIRARLEATLASDYRQITDLGRFLAGDEPYYVR